MNRSDAILKVAIVGIESPAAGGAYTAENLMLKQIQRVLEGNEIVLISESGSSFRLWKTFLRIKRIIEGIFFLWNFRPVTWSVVHRFRWLPTSKFERELLRNNIDLVFFVGAYDRAIELKKIPFIATIWDLGHRDLPSLPELGSDREFEYRDWRIRNIAIKAHAMVVDSEVTRTKLSNYYGISPTKIYALPFCPGANAVPSISERESFAFYPAHYWSHKNHMVLFDAIASLVSMGHKPRHLKLTGLDRGNLSYLSKKVIELQISEYVEFLGFISSSELDYLYRQAAIMVMPSLLGPTNLPPLEALLRGCPVAVNETASANLRDWPGVIKLNGFDTQAWAEVLNIQSKFEQVNSQEIQQFLFENEELNVKQLKLIFDNFRRIKRTHTTS